MYKHTPPPWKLRFLSDSDDSDFFVEAKNNNMPQLGYGIEILQDDFGEHNGYPREQRLADAKLIAAAPELLSTLKNLVHSATHFWDEIKPIKDSNGITVCHPMIEEAKEAIKKATE